MFQSSFSDSSVETFPILLKVCGKERDNGSQRFRNYGYDGERDFFGGFSKFNDMIVGWNGHTENGSTIGPLKGKKFVSVRARCAKICVGQVTQTKEKR